MYLSIALAKNVHKGRTGANHSTHVPVKLLYCIHTFDIYIYIQGFASSSSPPSPLTSARYCTFLPYFSYLVSLVLHQPLAVEQEVFTLF